jgi:hypothetical protein
LLVKGRQSSNSPRPGAILFVIARPLVHDVWSVLTPGRCTFVIESHDPFCNGRECANGSPSRQLNRDRLIVRRF